ncbi:hypothetical protein [Asticcacaulis machinosus]|uniref:Uncharacterized protein n=1 Tax=Asticcacaulis machinosus TaxID=2984211 RepID=A0ABT5HGK2_9CAUL|nr:hypothetical protein [Asticcacaulis machinosus]MDC7675390.1 hypothetical protein [Asticcacaulis machinosus]
MMRDIAAIYSGYWTQGTLSALPLEELVAEHQGAIKRYNLMNGIKD